MITDDKTKTQKGYKSTVIGMLPQEWDVKKLKDITDYVDYRGKTPPKVENGIFLVTAKNIKDGFIDYDISKEYVKEEDYESIMRRGKPKIGDVLLTTEAPLGNVAQVDRENIALAQRIIKFRGKKGLSNDYLKYHFLSNQFQERLKKRAIGTTVLGIQGKELHNMYIPIPSLEEQQKIADILSTWDKAIKIKEKLIEQKKLQKKGLMQKLLTGEVRLPGFEGEWIKRKIKDISKVYRGASPRPINDPKWFDENSQIGWVRISDVTRSKKCLHKTEQYLSEEGVKKSRFVAKNNIIMSICATVGKPIFTGFDVCIHDGFVVFEDLKINKDYFYYVLLKLENQWSKYGQTGSQMNLNTDIVDNEKITFPPDEREQQAIVDVLSSIDKEIDLHEQELEALKQQKKGLMQLLLTGKVRVKV